MAFIAPNGGEELPHTSTGTAGGSRPTIQGTVTAPPRALNGGEEPSCTLEGPRPGSSTGTVAGGRDCAPSPPPPLREPNE
eukprot:6430442-Karenia_brevis.AAC.1